MVIEVGEKMIEEILEQLIAIPSPTGQEGKVGEYLSALLRNREFSVEHQKIQPGRFNVIGKNVANPEVLFCTHIDTVEPFVPASRRSGKIFGRGACDAKGSIAAMIGASDRLSHEERQRVGFLLVVGEENDSIGARMAAQLDIRPKVIVLGEPTRNRMASGQKGTLVFRLISRGKSGHSAYPELGRSALHELVKMLSIWINRDWGVDPKLGPTTLNVGLIQGGTGANVIAGQASAKGIFRVSTSLAEVKDQVENLLAEEISFEVISESEPLLLDCLDGFASEVVAFGSDAPYLRALGRVIMMGPGSIQFAHHDDEQILETELMEAVELYTRVAKTVLR